MSSLGMKLNTAALALAFLLQARPLFAEPPVLQTHEAPSADNPVLEAFAPQPSGLTANAVAQRATASSHTIAAKNAELRAAAAKVDSAMYQFLPHAGLKASYSRQSKVINSLGEGALLASSGTGPYTVGPQGSLVDENGKAVGGYGVSFPVYVNTYSLSASLSVPLSDYVLRMSNSITGTKLNREAAELNIKAERAKVQGDARVAFFNWARAIGQVAVTEKSLDRVKARLKDVQASFSVGMVTKADLLRMQAQVAAIESTLESAKGFRNLAAEQLAVIMHDKRADYVLGENVLVQTASPPASLVEELVAEAEQHRLELKAMESNVQALHKAESVVQAGQYPKVDGFADFTYANPNQRYMFATTWKSTWAAGVQATWALNDPLINHASAQELKANRETSEANRDALVESIRLEVTSAYTDERKASAELEAARRSAEASQAAYDASILLYKVGKATTSELIDAEDELVSSNLRLINTHIDMRVAETKLARATGRDLSDLRK